MQIRLLQLNPSILCAWYFYNTHISVSLETGTSWDSVQENFSPHSHSISSQVDGQLKGKENICRGTGMLVVETMEGWQTQALPILLPPSVCGPWSWHRLLILCRLVPRHGREEWGPCSSSIQLSVIQLLFHLVWTSPAPPGDSGTPDSCPSPARWPLNASHSYFSTSLFPVAFYHLPSLTSLPATLGMGVGAGGIIKPEGNLYLWSLAL